MKLRACLPAPVIGVGGLCLLALACGGGQEAPDGSPPTPAVSIEDIPEGVRNLCERPLPPLVGRPITGETFAAMDAGMEQVRELAEGGDISGAHRTFFTQVHDFTHDLDAPLRERDAELAKRLCAVVAQIEAEFAFGSDAAAIADYAGRVQALLRDAAAELGYGE